MTQQRCLKLTDKQFCFVEEYLIDLNATQAAIRAGYSEHTAQVIGAENLSKPIIQNAISERMAEIVLRTKRNADNVLTDLATIRTNAMTLINDKEGNKVMVNINAALRALELEGKHLAMWMDKHQLSGDDDNKLVINIVKFGSVGD